MNKKFKGLLSGIFLFLFFLSFVFFVKADVIFSAPGTIANSDLFFSPYETYINVSISGLTVGGPGTIMNVTANFSAINTTACTGDGLLNLTYISGNWIGNCTVSSLLTNNGSVITPYLGNITFFSTDSNNKRNYSGDYGLPPTIILLHNLGMPNISMPGNGCQIGQIGRAHV